MSRSLKKGPYINERLLKKLERGDKEPIKTWARNSQIPPQFVGHRFSVHNGKDFIDVFIVEDMVGYRLGEFVPTRTFRGHGRVVKRTIEKT
jgi:small subunit ribosomal protein S19